VTYREKATTPLTDVEGLSPGDGLRIVLARGTLRATVTEASKEGER
jgi:hypothetical protein